ncbi:MAG: AAA family ATPase, partial [Paracoccaceae bacterium]
MQVRPALRESTGASVRVAIAGQTRARAALADLREGVAVVLGPPGAGKTALAAEAARARRDERRVERVSASLAARGGIGALLALAFGTEADIARETASGRVLLHIDDAHELSPDDLAALGTVLDRLEAAGAALPVWLTGQALLARRLAACADPRLAAAGERAERLAPATSDEIGRLLAARAAPAAIEPEAAERLVAAAAGSPGRAVR